MKSNVQILRPGNQWYVNDMGRILGPMSWEELTNMANKAQVTPYAHIKEENWPQWVPIVWYLRVKTKEDLEIEGLIPSRYDAMFYLGIFLFMIGIVLFIGIPLLGLAIIIAATGIEIKALQLEKARKGKSMTRSFGNFMAWGWIVLQIVITIFMAIMLF